MILSRLAEVSLLFEKQPICDRVEVKHPAEGLANGVKISSRSELRLH